MSTLTFAARSPRRSIRDAGALSLFLFATTVSATLRAQTASPPDGESKTESCIASHVEAQRLRRDSKLRAAREALLRCADPACPQVISEECTAWFEEAGKALPTLVFGAQDADGHDVAGTRVTENGAVVLERLDGKEVEVDPGEHRYVFEHPGDAAITRTLVVKEGDKLRRVSVKFGADDRAPGALSTREIGPAFWIVGAVGLVGVTAFGALATAGLVSKNNLDDDGCAPRCDTADVDRIRGLFLGADIALGVGLAGLAIAPILYFTSPTTPSAAASVSGGGLSWGGTF